MFNDTERRALSLRQLSFFVDVSIVFTGVARGAVGAPAPPRAEKKILGVIYRENW